MYSHLNIFSKIKLPPQYILKDKALTSMNSVRAWSWPSCTQTASYLGMRFVVIFQLSCLLNQEHYSNSALQCSIALIRASQGLAHPNPHKGAQPTFWKSFLRGTWLGRPSRLGRPQLKLSVWCISVSGMGQLPIKILVKSTSVCWDASACSSVGSLSACWSCWTGACSSSTPSPCRSPAPSNWLSWSGWKSNNF